MEEIIISGAVMQMGYFLSAAAALGWTVYQHWQHKEHTRLICKLEKKVKDQ